MKKDMVKRLSPHICRLNENAQVFNEFRLPGKFFDRLRTNGILIFPLL
jgi:hypothetical protein